MRDVAFNERSRHALIAVSIALLIGAITLLRPLDIAGWSIQSKLVDHSASGEIVFVRMEEEAGHATPAGNKLITQTIRNLEAAGAERIFVNIPLRTTNASDVDKELRDLIGENSQSISLTVATKQDDVDSDRLPETSRYFLNGSNFYANDYDADFLNIIWGFEATQEYGGERISTLSHALARNETGRTRVSIDYTIKAETIPIVAANSLATNTNQLEAADKTFVIGTEAYSAGLKAPGSSVVSPTIVHILAAETLMRGSGYSIPWFALLVVFGAALLVLVNVGCSTRQRRQFYAIWCALIVACFFATSYLGIRVFFADVTLFAGVYATFRGVASYRRRHLYIDPISKLPNFLSMIREIEDHGEEVSIVVAKVARLDAIFARLGQSDRRSYVKQVANRLTLADDRTKIYADGGKYLAFITKRSEIPDLQSHLEGLRAIASQPVQIQRDFIDVALTIGADDVCQQPVDSRLSSAIAAADQAREAFKPVFVISANDNEKETWDHSLTARLADALAEDRVTIKLQPQVDLASQNIVGAEVLARWCDIDGHEVPPAKFISQCERMGRLDDLTRRIFEKGLAAAEQLQKQGFDATLSINVSAIQFVDDRIAEIIEESLKQVEVDTRRIIIELTETARIENFAVARSVFKRLKRQGFRFSMDDFGVGSANIEALLELPFDEVKIDRMFTAQLKASSRARAIVAGVVNTAATSRIISVSEGIEDRETYDLLRSIGCERGQGFFIGRPQTVSQFISILQLQKDETALSKRAG